MNDNPIERMDIKLFHQTEDSGQSIISMKDRRLGILKGIYNHAPVSDEKTVANEYVLERIQTKGKTLIPEKISLTKATYPKIDAYLGFMENPGSIHCHCGLYRGKFTEKTRTLSLRELTEKEHNALQKFKIY